MSAEVRCEGCGLPMVYRAREVIADVLHNAALHCATQPTDWTKRFTDLVARLAWVEGELRSICNTCVLEQVIQTRADAKYPPTPEEIERRYVERSSAPSPFLQPRLRVVREGT